MVDHHLATPAATDAELKDRVTLGPAGAVTVTSVAPPTMWLARSESLSMPEKEWDPAVLEAVTV